VTHRESVSMFRNREKHFPQKITILQLKGLYSVQDVYFHILYGIYPPMEQSVISYILASFVTKVLKKLSDSFDVNRS
jgi:hypothetical protein